MTLEQIALAIARLYGVLALTLGFSFLCFWALSALFPASLNEIAPYLSHYGAVSFQYGIVHFVSGCLFLVFGRHLARFMTKP